MKILNAVLLVALAAPLATQGRSQAAAVQETGPRPADAEPAARLAAQREAMQSLSFLDGEWRGEAETADAPGTFVQTERVGSLLDGTVKLIEGRGYDAGGATVFNAFGIISYDPGRRAYSFRSYAMGHAADFPLTIREDGFSWSHPAGPGTTMRYTATVRGDAWHQVGERVTEGAPPVRTFEMRLRRVGTTEWPQAGAVAIR